MSFLFVCKHFSLVLQTFFKFFSLYWNKLYCLHLSVDYVVQEPLPETLQERRPPEFGQDQDGQKLALGGTRILVTKSHLYLSLMAKFQSPWSGHLETSWGCGRGGERGKCGHPHSSRKQLKGELLVSSVILVKLIIVYLLRSSSKMHHIWAQ